MENIKELFTQAIAHNEARYIDKQREMFNFAHNGVNYKLKPMFIDKYSKAYSMGLDDVEAGVVNPQVNMSVYNENELLINITIAFDDFKAFFRAVKDEVRPIEAIYQQMLAEFSELETQATTNPNLVIARLNEILTSNPYD